MNHVLKYGIVILLLAAFMVIPIIAAETCSDPATCADNLTVNLTEQVLINETVPTPTPTPPVGANHDLDYTNKYEPVVIDRGDGMGMLYVTVACHHTLISSTFVIQRVEQTGVDKLVYGIPLTEGNLKYLKFIGANITRNLNPSGTFDERFVPQDLLVTLKDGNAGQPEYQLAKIAAGEKSYVNFLGHAISQLTCDRFSILEATYGMQVCELHPEYRYRTWIPATQGWMEYFGDYSVTFESQWHGAYDKVGDYYVYHTGSGHGSYKVDDFHHGLDGSGDYIWSGGWFGHFVYVGHTYHEGTPAHCSEFSGWSDTNPQLPACNGEVCTAACQEMRPSQDCTMLGGFAEGVTSAVQYVIDHGHLSFIFDNRPDPGGIFAPDGTTLLYEIKDPAPGLIKQVHIVYNNGCGGDQTIDAQEYAIITLGTSIAPPTPD